MSDNNNPTPNKSAGKAPSHHAYHVREFGEGSEKKGFWTRIGSAWAHRDGKGFNLKLDCLPVDGNVVLRAASEEPGQ
mgnify:CR=1 FL=1